MRRARRWLLLGAAVGMLGGGGGAAVGGGLASASPGGLDRAGGHHCWTRCHRYGLYRGQYHCHRSPCNRRTVQRHRGHGH